MKYCQIFYCQIAYTIGNCFSLLCHLMNEEIGNIHSFYTFLFYAYNVPSTFLNVKVTKINKHNSSYQKTYFWK